jgi:predicted enzyme related to lactoylglutathione lyase
MNEKEEKNIQLGKFEICFDVPDIESAVKFYEKLGFKPTKGAIEYGTISVSNGDIQFTFFAENYIKKEFGVCHLFNFRGGDVEEIYETLKEKNLDFEMTPRRWKDGSIDAKLKDPSGNLIYFDTTPEERENSNNY